MISKRSHQNLYINQIKKAIRASVPAIIRARYRGPYLRLIRLRRER
jgi:hypothetical protein